MFAVLVRVSARLLIGGLHCMRHALCKTLRLVHGSATLLQNARLQVTFIQFPFYVIQFCVLSNVFTNTHPCRLLIKALNWEHLKLEWMKFLACLQCKKEIMVYNLIKMSQHANKNRNECVCRANAYKKKTIMFESNESCKIITGLSEICHETIHDYLRVMIWMRSK